MRGRKPVLRALDGGLAHIPAPPARLGGEAREEWFVVLPDLVARRVLEPAVMSSVEAYCLAVGALRECQGIIAREGHTVSTPGGPKRHPASIAAAQFLSEQRRWAAELGLTPASRGRAASSTPGKEEADAYADLGI